MTRRADDGPDPRRRRQPRRPGARSSAFLDGEGHDAIEADSGERALELLRDGGRGVDLVLLDLLMPGIDGFETLAPRSRATSAGAICRSS